MSLSRMKMLQVSKCLIGLAVVMLQSCETVDNRRDLLCGNWESVEGKPDVLIYKEGEAYKVTVFKRSGLRRKLKPETYLLQEENGNLFMNTGFRIDVSYNEAADILTFSPNGDYVRSAKKMEDDMEDDPGFSIAEDAIQGVSFPEISELEDILKDYKKTSSNDH
ncbi:MAG: hypothetical protein PARBB_01907 [Parabacteroides distasonis]|uniref:DUF3876 domain-containing protein n=1 Tax=Bacteroides xylanisolvens TaxID=371601 RepID=A0A7J5PZN2_9BACE|nr:DUF3876 domain-containing protein [Bacteroides xylanisolvens]KAB6148399.1 DUF3876 domain-containing protein [Bacteroides xylanisolvens]